MWHHPKYYAALRAAGRKLQASSDKPKETNSPDDKIQDHQASSNKPQA